MALTLKPSPGREDCGGFGTKGHVESRERQREPRLPKARGGSRLGRTARVREGVGSLRKAGEGQGVLEERTRGLQEPQDGGPRCGTDRSQWRFVGADSRWRLGER